MIIGSSLAGETTGGRIAHRGAEAGVGKGTVVGIPQPCPFMADSTSLWSKPANRWFADENGRSVSYVVTLPALSVLAPASK